MDGPIKYKDIQKLKQLDNNWDSYDGVPTSLDVISVARMIIYSLEKCAWNPNDLMNSNVHPLPNGGLDIEINSMGFEIEISISKSKEESQEK